MKIECPEKFEIFTCVHPTWTGLKLKIKAHYNLLEAAKTIK